MLTKGLVGAAPGGNCGCSGSIDRRNRSLQSPGTYLLAGIILNCAAFFPFGVGFLLDLETIALNRAYIFLYRA